MHFLNKKTVLSLVLTGFVCLSILPGTAHAAAPKASAVCTSGGRFELNMTPLSNQKYWALRAHDHEKAFVPQNQGDSNFMYNKLTDTTYVRNITVGKGYWWWIYSISDTGVWSEATVGYVHCPLKEPIYLEQSYDKEKKTLNLSWRAVEGAVKYGIRVDNLRNSWNPDQMRSGDIKEDGVTSASYSFRIQDDQEVYWWVYAIDKYGQWSDSSKALYIRTK